jgi:serine protease
MAIAAPSGHGSTAGTSARGHQPHVRVTNLHAEFARLRAQHVFMGPRAGIVPPLGHGIHRKPNTKPATGPLDSCTEPNCNMPYNGGPTQHNPKLYVVFWGSTWPSNATEQEVLSYELNFLGGLGASGDTWSLTNSQYADGTGNPTFGQKELVASIYDTSNPPSEVFPSDIASEAAAAASSMGVTDLADAQVIVLSQSGTCFSDGFAGSSCQPVPPAYCAWHSATAFASGLLSYTNMPYSLDAGGSCGENFINSGSAGTFDGFSIVGGHEWAETVTDPQPSSGYRDLSDSVSGGEIGDKCAWGGLIWGSSDPDGNVTLSTGTFAMQSLWSNATGNCAMSGVSVSSLGNQTSVLGHAASVQVQASAAPDVTLSYSASGLPSGLSINSSTGLIHGTVSGPVKQYSSKVSVVYPTGSSTSSFKWTVNAVGPVKGPWSKCVDNANGNTVGGNKIDLFTCNGKAQQRITRTPAGQLKVQTGCITGDSSEVFFEPCSGATSQVWTRTGSEYVNKATGKCLNDPNLAQANGTQLTVATCNNKTSQLWSLP